MAMRGVFEGSPMATRSDGAGEEWGSSLLRLAHICPRRMRHTQCIGEELTDGVRVQGGNLD
ncbi:hypothetical protein E2562_027900 [Oryza meyeriana var. granulata]|uniref:Uncharacterized protein n=1 Tax=Oryza meyeriana var. granulata TaxID=110450 RepID=A0A6G1CVC6_9ORYZ|nr:hypothetical protein E2562_027900 [Oryza meyeriana var. granulata]